MAKKGFLVLVLAGLTAGMVFAQSNDGKTWNNSYAPGIDAGKVFINAGIGYGFSSYSMGIPPISVSADFKLPVKLPITLGGTAALSTWEYSILNWKITYMNIGFGLRGAYHFNFVKNLDTYLGLTLGYVIQSATGDGAEYYKGTSFFLYGGFLGARYFFTKNIGAYLELGYSGLQVASIGLALKF